VNVQKGIFIDDRILSRIDSENHCCFVRSPVAKMSIFRLGLSQTHRINRHSHLHISVYRNVCFIITRSKSTQYPSNSRNRTVFPTPRPQLYRVANFFLYVDKPMNDAD